MMKINLRPRLAPERSSRKIISAPRLAEIKANALGLIHTLGSQLAILELGERELRSGAVAGLKELEGQVERFGRAIARGNQFQADFMLTGIKHFINSYLQAADAHANFMVKNDLPVKARLLIDAQVQYEMINSFQKMMRADGSMVMTNAVLSQGKAKVLKEVSELTPEVERLEDQLQQEDQVSADIKARIDKSYSGGIIPDDPQLFYDLMKLKIEWFRSQLGLLNFRLEQMLPKRQRLVTLHSLLTTYLGLNATEIPDNFN